MNATRHLLAVVLILMSMLFQDASCSDAVAEAYLEQGGLLLKRGLVPEATALFLKTDKHLREASSKGLYGDKVYAGTLYSTLGECFRKLSESATDKLELFKLSEDYFAQALEVREEAFGTDSIEVAKILEGLGHTYFDRNKIVESEAVFRKAIKIREQNEGKDSCSLYFANYMLGRILMLGSSTLEAEEFFKKADAIAEKCFGKTDARVGRIQQEWAFLLFHYRKYPRGAVGHYDKAISIFQMHGAETKKNLIDCKKMFRGMLLNMHTNAYDIFYAKLSQKPSSGKEILPELDSLIAATRRIDKPVDDLLSRRRVLLRGGRINRP